VVRTDILAFLENVGGRSANQLATTLGLPSDLVEAALSDLVERSEVQTTRVDGVTLYRIVSRSPRRAWFLAR
jgi:predicted ArsR family transcriptional regulator